MIAPGLGGATLPSFPLLRLVLLSQVPETSQPTRTKPNFRHMLYFHRQRYSVTMWRFWCYRNCSLLAPPCLVGWSGSWAGRLWEQRAAAGLISPSPSSSRPLFLSFTLAPMCSGGMLGRQDVMGRESSLGLLLMCLLIHWRKIRLQMGGFIAEDRESFTGRGAPASRGAMAGSWC